MIAGTQSDTRRQPAAVGDGRKRLLILSASAGAGHVRAAQAGSPDKRERRELRRMKEGRGR